VSTMANEPTPLGYDYNHPPIGPHPCIQCFHPTRNHRAVWNYNGCRLWYSACRNVKACAARYGGTGS
jgi:hypothetical protein